MPTLRKRKDIDKYYVLTSISGRVITFQLTKEGQQTLLTASLKDGDRFDRAILFDLYRKGDAFTLAIGASYQSDDSHQLSLDFPDDTNPESLFPSCSRCSSVQDLHLVTISDDKVHDSYILCQDCRKTGAFRPGASIPLHIVSRSIIARLQEMGHLHQPDAKLAHYRDHLETDFQKKWDELRQKKSRRQEALFHADGGPQGRLID